MIKFGTSGWRGIIADEFTFDNVKLVTQAIADYINSQQKITHTDKIGVPEVVVGYDTRFMSEEFAKVCACVLSGNNIHTLYSKRDIPTPVISYYIIAKKLSGGINITASHNPPEYSGLKFTPAWGGPALPETTKEIEQRCQQLSTTQGVIREIKWEEGKKKKLITTVNFVKDYMGHIRKIVDLDTIKKRKMKIIIDLLHGTGKGYLDTLIKETASKVKVINSHRDVLFDNRSPEPSEENLTEMITLMKEKNYDLGLSVDGDADRFGIVDSDGTYITPNQVIALLLYHLVKRRKWTGVVARSVMTTHFIDAIARKYNIEVKETPVGFKFIGDIMVNEPEKFIIGGEESGGLSIRNHVPEKDGILACLLITELVAYENKSIKQILTDLYTQVGKYITTRINLRITPEQLQTLKIKLSTKPLQEIAGIKVTQIVTIDGYKYLLEDGSWVGLRFSGTEPVIRLYFETNTDKKLTHLIYDMKKYIHSTE